ncbi:hypothetical protein BJ508DRAFT_360346 [Ascobolus immersus RN42]|uniref:Increased loss of mitochondrial DNA protein 1 n=1 Tax=Ascobolus immersus RN42 TaxID=1160509 RepID=A0A3N4IHN5_ASCIM|nr:hypothetical protein BJ508DRAFT_360346 [Ascobolus immersus RN42]
MPAAFTIINVLTALHLTLGTVLLYDPNKLITQDALLVFGEAMAMPPVPKSFASGAGLAGLLFLLLAITDILVIISPSNLFQREYWRTQAPFRATFFTVLSGYLFLSKPGYREWKNDFPVRNRLIFTWSFLEFVAWYLVFHGLHEEAKRVQIERKDEPGTMAEDERNYDIKTRPQDLAGF